MIHSDSRFPTSNTNFAACLGALAIPIKNVQPCTVHIDAETKKKTFTFYFDLEGNDFAGDKHSAEKLDWAWKNRDEFEESNKKHPLVPMRLAIDSLSWLVRLKHGEVSISSHRHTEHSTDDIELAACLRASGFPVVGFDSRNFYFNSIPKKVVEQFSNYNMRGQKENAVALMRRALFCRAELISLVKRCPECVRYTNGDPQSGSFSVADIVIDAPEEKKSLLLDAFYSL